MSQHVLFWLPLLLLHRYFEYDGSVLRWGSDPRTLTTALDLTVAGASLSSTYHTSLFTRKPPSSHPYVFAVNTPQRVLKLAFGDVHERNSWFRAMSTPGTPQAHAVGSKLQLPSKVKLALQLVRGRGLAAMDVSGTSDPYVRFWVASPPSLRARATAVGFVDSGEVRLALRAIMPNKKEAKALKAAGEKLWSVVKAAYSKRRSRTLEPVWNETINVNVKVNDVSGVLLLCHVSTHPSGHTRTPRPASPPCCRC